jgi:transformation/transcription domain-associated protein
LLERRDVANKSELSRLAMAQQRLQQGVSSTSAASLGLADGNARIQGHGVSSTNQLHQGAQSSGGIGSHDGGSSHGQEPEQPGAESSVHAGNDQALHQSTSTINEGGQNALRRSGALGLVASAASAFDAAKDIMEALRSKHTNLASELEVNDFHIIFFKLRK